MMLATKGASVALFETIEKVGSKHFEEMKSLCR